MKFSNVTEVMLLILIVSLPFSSIATIPNEINVGDTFAFKVLRASASKKVNGTEYASPLEIKAGDIIDVEITNLGNDDDGNTYVNVTETVNGDTTASTSTYIDEWQKGPLLMLLYGAFSLAFFPALTSFDAPEPEPEDRVDTFFPYFANSNESFYIELENDIIDLDDEINNIEGLDSNFARAVADYDRDTAIFTFEFTWNYSNETVYRGDIAKISYDATFKATIDVTRSLVSYVLFLLSSQMSIGAASKSELIEAEFEEYHGETVQENTTDTNILAGLADLSFPGVILLISMVVALIPLHRKTIKMQ